MSEYINKAKLYEEIAHLEEFARDRFLDTPHDDLYYEAYREELNEMTALKHFIADFETENILGGNYDLDRLNELAKADSNGEGIKTCENCVNRFLCPNNYRACDGYNDEKLFWRLMALRFPSLKNMINESYKFIKSSQEENIERKGKTND